MVSVFLVFLVCAVGIVGNAVVVLTTRDVHTPTNCSLVSLARADLTVLVAAGLPTVSQSLAGQWVCGHAGCLGITCLRYLGIRASNSSVPRSPRRGRYTPTPPAGQDFLATSLGKLSLLPIYGGDAVWDPAGNRQGRGQVPGSGLLISPLPLTCCGMPRQPCTSLGLVSPLGTWALGLDSLLGLFQL